MAVVRQSDKLNDRKLQIIRSQLYGKEKPLVITPEGRDRRESLAGEKELQVSPKVSMSSHQTIAVSPTYLTKDLTRIFLLSTIAIGAQVLLWILLRNGIVKF